MKFSNYENEKVRLDKPARLALQLALPSNVSAFVPTLKCKRFRLPTYPLPYPYSQCKRFRLPYKCKRLRPSLPYVPYPYFPTFHPTSHVNFFTSDFSLSPHYLINGARCQEKRKLILGLTSGRFYGIMEVERKNP